MHARAFRALERLYAHVTERLAELRLDCRACGSCCALRAWGHEVYVTGLEAACLRAWAREHGVAPQPSGPDACPYHADGACTVHPARALGCRLFFCRSAGNRSEAVARALEDLSVEAHARLRDLHRAYRIVYKYQALPAALAVRTASTGTRAP